MAVLLLAQAAKAHTYGEHKEIGDQAFQRFMLSLHAQHTDVPGFFSLKKDSLSNTYYFPAFSAAGTGVITYGTLNALSGDHVANPLLLEEQLRVRSSVIRSIAALHEQYIAMGYTAAPDGKLTRIDFSYALLAATNIAHFYEYKKSFQAQLRYFNKETVSEGMIPSRVTAVFKKLGKTNALNVYVTLHSLAIVLAEQAGTLAQHNNNAEAGRLLFYAFLFNAFADHFLEDAFSAGHLVVNRTIAASLTNNKALHDFYCANGTTVINRKKEIWYAYGDGQFNRTHGQWEKQHTLADIEYKPYTAEADRIIEAVRLSLADIWTAFQKTFTGTAYTPWLAAIPDRKEQQADFLISHIPALQLVPIPYNSNLASVIPGPVVITDSMKKANQLLPLRDFVRSRVANSLVVGTMQTSATGHIFSGFEFRINAGNFARKYSFNTAGTKKGVMDYWLGYTLAYSRGESSELKHRLNKYNASQLRAGIRANIDYWVSDRKFLGIYSYLESGVQWIDHGQSYFIFVPSLGYQLGSLFNINYYSMPAWLRIPVELLMPLRFRYGAVIANGQYPHYFTGIDLDIFF